MSFKLGSILTATNDQFRVVYQGIHSKKKVGFGENEFVEEFNERKQAALTDNTTIGNVGVTQGQIVANLQDIIEKTKKVYQETGETITYDRYSNASSNPIVIDDRFDVSRQKSYPLSSQCIFCQHGFIYPMSYRIKNIRTNQEIQVNEEVVHLIKDHDYFGRVGGCWRLDPLLTCQVLQLEDWTKSGQKT